MEVIVEGESSGGSKYTLNPTRILNEDILICVDVDAESMVEMKSTGPNGRPLTRFESIKQAILMFINAKLSINPDHRFAFATLSKSASLVLTLSLSLAIYIITTQIELITNQGLLLLSIFETRIKVVDPIIAVEEEYDYLGGALSIMELITKLSIAKAH